MHWFVWTIRTSIVRSAQYLELSLGCIEVTGRKLPGHHIVSNVIATTYSNSLKNLFYYELYHVGIVFVLLLSLSRSQMSIGGLI